MATRKQLSIPQVVVVCVVLLTLFPASASGLWFWGSDNRPKSSRADLEESSGDGEGSEVDETGEWDSSMTESESELSMPGSAEELLSAPPPLPSPRPSAKPFQLKRDFSITVHRPNTSCHLNPNTSCHLDVWQSDIKAQLIKARLEKVDMITLTLVLPEYSSTVPLLLNSSTRYYRPDRVYRILTERGSDLLRLPFNRLQLSAGTLLLNTREYTVQLVDLFPGCYSHLKDEDKMTVATRLLLTDFETHTEVQPWADPAERLCRQVMANDSTADYVRLVYECCHVKTGGHVECEEVDEKVAGVCAAHIITAIVKLIFIAVAPLIFVRTCLPAAAENVDYIIPLEKELHKTLMLKRVHLSKDCDDNGGETACCTGAGVAAGGKDARPFRHFRDLVKTIPSDTVVPIVFRNLHVTVDGSQLVPASRALSAIGGVWRRLYEAVLLCGPASSTPPVDTCCRASIFGTWSSRFLCFKLCAKAPNCSEGSCRYCSWLVYGRLLGAVLLLAVLLLPYGLRLLVYYLYEHEEMDDRYDFAEQVSSDAALWPQDADMLHMLTPTSLPLVAVYATLASTFITIIVMRMCCRSSIDKVIADSLSDLQRIQPSACLRLFTSHLLLPFEKFGVCGLLVGILYWPLVVPLCVIISIFYCLPAVYLTGRLLYGPRASCLSNGPACCALRRTRGRGRGRNKSAESGSLTRGTTSVEHCLHLDRISPAPAHLDTAARKQSSSFYGISNCLGAACSHIKTFLIGSLCVAFMYALLLLYAECVGYVCQLAILALYGAFLNARRVALYVVLGGWLLVYTILSLLAVHRLYRQADRLVLECLSRKLGTQLQLAHLHSNKHIAFKIPGSRATTAVTSSTVHIDADNEDDIVHTTRSKLPGVKPQDDCVSDDVVEDKQGKLQWRLHSVVLFLDGGRHLRIPIALSRALSATLLVDRYTTVAKTLMGWLASGAYLGLLIAVMAALDMLGDSPSVYQLLLTAGVGALPLPFLLRPICCSRANLSQSLSEAKIERVVNSFEQTWMAFDLQFTADSDDGADEQLEDGNVPIANGALECVPPASLVSNRAVSLNSAPEQTSLERLKRQRLAQANSCTHVDLVITIRDEPDTTSQLSNKSLTSPAPRYDSVSAGASLLPARQTPDDSRQVVGAQTRQPRSAMSAAATADTMPKQPSFTADLGGRGRQDAMDMQSSRQELTTITSALPAQRSSTDGPTVRSSDQEAGNESSRYVSASHLRSAAANKHPAHKDAADTPLLSPPARSSQQQHAEEKWQKNAVDVKEKVVEKDKFPIKNKVIGKDELVVEPLPAGVRERAATNGSNQLLDDTASQDNRHASINELQSYPHDADY